MIDSHVHTARCRHGAGTAADAVLAARAVGVTAISITEHLPLPDGFDEGYAMPAEELPDYIAEVLELKERSEAGSPEVLLGIEADWIPARAEKLAQELAAYPYDVVLGSVHFIDDWAFDDPELTHAYENWSQESLWERYFAELVTAAQSGLFDVMAHPDLVKKFNFRPEAEPLELYDEVARELAQTGVAIEVSTAGLRKPCAEMYPSQGFLNACGRAGVLATTGSDAHRPEEVGYRLESAHEALRLAGYHSVALFRGRHVEERGL